MGVKDTLPNFKSFTFDGTNSRSYGVYITGEGVFNAPERNVEMIDIPGRNGAYALDKGNFNNIEVTYPAGIFADSETDFATAVSDLRNLLCSKVGYVRLEDDYNPNEYRLAIYKSGLEVSHDMLIAGEFDITFECKPQRFLTSGETAVSVASGGTLTNPTLFDSHPQLQVKGYGNIDINGAYIDLENVPVGNTFSSVSPATKITWGGFSASFTGSMFATGDTVSLTDVVVEVTFTISGSYQWTSRYSNNVTNCSITSSSSSNAVTYVVTIPQFDFTIGTSSSASNSSFDFHWALNNSGGSGSTTITMHPSYNGSNGINFGLSSSASTTHITKNAKTTTGSVSGYSSKTISDTIYIDLDIGEVWATIGGNTTALNNVTQLPAELPVLASGSNTITYDNTFTSFKVLPRWWKV